MPTTVSELEDADSYLQDSDISDWARAETKPSYTYAEIAEKPELSTVATTGSYEDLSDKPTIPSVEGLLRAEDAAETYALKSELTPLANVQSDWNEADNTKDSYIANKPSLSAVATSGNYNDLSNKPELSTVATTGDYEDLTNKPTIPSVEGLLRAEDAAETYALKSELTPLANVQADWTEADNTKDSYIANKPSLSAVATSGDYTDLEHTPDLSVYALKTDLTPLGNVQPNWEQEDEDAADFIKNKPTIPTSVSELDEYDSFVQFSNLSDVATTGDYNDLEHLPELATVATSGDYADLSNTPTNVSEFTNDAEYISKTEFDEMKASYERQMLGLRAEMAVGKTYKGAFMSAFSVSADRKVVFSQGNLQYQPSTGTWRFAEHQYDVVGGLEKNVPGNVGGNVYENGVKCDNNNVNNESYTGWIDLFCYGTSGWNGSGALAYKPTDYTGTNTDYTSENLYGDYENADWGMNNAIVNGGNKKGLWRTLTLDEWKYVMVGRENASNLFAYARISIDATVDGVTEIAGFILLPDDWILPDGCSFTATPMTLTDSNNGVDEYAATQGFDANTYTVSQWQKMQAAGAVFFPGAGIANIKNGALQLKNVIHDNEYIGYWSSSTGTPSVKTVNSGWLCVDKTKKVVLGYNTKAWGLNVRLVRDIE